MRFLRNQDRDLHQESYPALKFPEIYLLEERVQRILRRTTPPTANRWTTPHVPPRPQGRPQLLQDRLEDVRGKVQRRHDPKSSNVASEDEETRQPFRLNVDAARFGAEVAANIHLKWISKHISNEPLCLAKISKKNRESVETNLELVSKNSLSSLKNCRENFSEKCRTTLEASIQTERMSPNI